MPNLRQTFGRSVRRERTAKGLTQAQLAEQCDLSLDMIGRIERGDAAPSFETVEKLTAALGVSAPLLFGPIRSSRQSAPRPPLDRVVERLEKLPEHELIWVERVLTALLRR